MLKRDVSGATLEDHFDKTILPKVMQVGKRELFLHSFTTLCWIWDQRHCLCGPYCMPKTVTSTGSTVMMSTYIRRVVVMLMLYYSRT